MKLATGLVTLPDIAVIEELPDVLLDASPIELMLTMPAGVVCQVTWLVMFCELPFE